MQIIISKRYKFASNRIKSNEWILENILTRRLFLGNRTTREETVLDDMIGCLIDQQNKTFAISV